MRFQSTRGSSQTATFAEAVNRGIAEDGGLFMPASIPLLPKDFLRSIDTLSFQEISFRVARILLEGEIPDSSLRTVVEEALTFPAPLHELDDNVSILELFHGPTLAFKDFGARFMARILAYLHRNDSKETTILVATSGDTGSAVAHGFHNIEGMTVVLLYPSGRVSTIQELQLTTLEGNVQALEIDGTFDDCQRLVKQAFADRDLTSTRTLTSANSINVARLLPQSFYYFNAFARLPRRDRPVNFSVPSGNLGNLTAGLIAWKMGLPVYRFIAATNSNDTLPRYLKTGIYSPAPAVATISNAMDVGNPSNFARIHSLCGGDLKQIQSILSSASFSDDATRDGIAEVFQQYGYLLDPHGAVAYAALKELSHEVREDSHNIVLETAHPAKFPDVYDEEQRGALAVPERLQAMLRGRKRSVRLSTRFEELKAYLLRS
jgi:threonine synthase